MTVEGDVPGHDQRKTTRDDYDPERQRAYRKALCASIMAIVIGLPLAYIGGSGRTYEVVWALREGATLPRALLRLAIRPIDLDLWIPLLAIFLAFLAWQFAAYRQRALLLLLPGALAAGIIPAEMVFHSYIRSVVHCDCNAISWWSGWYDLAIFVGILALSTWAFGRIGRALLRPGPMPWATARLAAFAWTNGGLLLSIAQLWFVYAHFGSGVFR